MKTAITFIAILFALLAYGMKQDKAKQDSIIDTAMQVEDTIGTRKTLNDIRFNGWERSDWLDNEYIRTLRKHLDDYNNGKISNSNLDPYKEHIKGQFVVYDINSYLLGVSLSESHFLTCLTGRSAVGYIAMWMRRKKRWKAISFVLSA